LERTAADPTPLPDLATDYELVREALDRLPAQDARVVRLYYLGGYNDREIAERTPRTYAPGQQSPTGRSTVSAAAIYQRRQNALNALRSSLTTTQHAAP